MEYYCVRCGQQAARSSLLFGGLNSAGGGWYYHIDLGACDAAAEVLP